MCLLFGGLTEESNLALACMFCNLNKGSDLAAIDPLSGEIVPLFNPRTQIWSEHFDVSDALILGITAIGRATVALLRLNDRERVDYRQSLIEIGRYPLPTTN